MRRRCDGDIVLLAEPEFLLIPQRAKSYRGTGTAISSAAIGHREAPRQRSVFHGVFIISSRGRFAASFVINGDV